MSFPQRVKRRFGRTSAHKRLLFRNLTTSLVLHGEIQTTLVKAKELRKYADRTIRWAKEGTPTAMKKAGQFLTSQEAVNRLFQDFPTRYQYRSGGYTRVRPFGYRKGDHAPMALIEFLRDDKEMKYEDYFVTTPKIQE
eukprot:TRINITY_DN3192_c0_g1_i1.p1 TRINITY_DN3192_c0_g1~~TRINITY_DN3192_c0_g1_i1.p1  ORF type:complete len:138 (-),score=23.56 TRINITY_DN3192_c0_g1_i1:108-521(-)